MTRTDAVVNFIRTFIHANGYSPSVRDIVHGCGFVTTSTAHFHLEKLQHAGLVTWNRYQSRTIRLVKEVA